MPYACLAHRDNSDANRKIITQQPYYWRWTNHIRAALYAAPAAAAAGAALLAWPPARVELWWAAPLTLASLAGAAPGAALVAAAASWARCALGPDRAVRAFRWGLQ